MNRERVTRLLLLVLLLGGGLLIGRWSLSQREEGDVDANPETDVDSSFRQWFWESRGLDLLVQTGLLFAGALGIAALLPKKERIG